MSSSLNSWPQILEILLAGKNLNEASSSLLMKAWLAEELTPVQTGAFLAAFRTKGMVGEELAAMAKVLQAACTLPGITPSLPLVDTCGTGGDGAETFNISTAVAFTASACGVNVAKHGNRSASGKVGSADVLESLGLDLKAPLHRVLQALEQVGITFLFAPAWHPALVNLAPLRKSLGIRTVFNLLGPLVNPLQPDAQVLGVATSDLLDPMAVALQRLGLKRAIVVYGAGGMDEASLEGSNSLRLLDNGQISDVSLDPQELGLNRASLDSLRGGDIDANKAILKAVLQGEGTAPQHDVVALNTALVLWTAGIEDDFNKGLALARSCIDNGLPWTRFEELRLALENKD